MNDEVLKSVWQGVATPQRTPAELKAIMTEKTHPVLKGIRQQLVIESIGFIALLLVYYDIFDGHQKPMYANVLLVGSLLFAIGHNLIGYFFARQKLKDGSISTLLENQLSRLKRYAVLSVLMRMLTTLGLLGFFMSAINLSEKGFGILLLAVPLVILQVLVLSRIWLRRIRQIQEAISSLWTEGHESAR